MAVLALDEPGGSARALVTVRVLREAGSAVLCYGNGVRHWPVGVQCRPVLAGAVHLLDSAQPGFAQELAARVGALHAAERERQAQLHDVRQMMRAVGFEGGSAALLATFRSVLRAAALSDVPALFLGETGTGKELLARAIHRLDLKRRGGPFVAVNCAAISPGVAESELFGHRRGAFTGAHQDRRGLVRSADGGVLFLDEVGELDTQLQGKLLRVLQQGRVLAVGDDREVAVDVRVIAATNRDLDEMVRQRAFRADLFHRLNVLTVRIPPLRERPDDVGPLVEHFAAQFGAGRGPAATERFVAALRQARLPGNVRQLENLVRRILAAREGDALLDLPDLPPEILREVAGSSSAAVSPPAGEDAEDDFPAPPADSAAAAMDPAGVLAANDWSLARSLAYCEALLMQAALAAAGGNHSRAARMLGITARSVYNKVHKHHLNG
ncbi:MAG TPA: sigma 54-interacting transcriptional regulator [Longimicrobiaceae bacterium]|nr:sigma 54-interacting transcriptional regulator [Longimicrobiaceae bacterium]